MVKAHEGFDANGRPDDVLKRITYDTTIYHNAFLFAEGAEENNTEEAKEKRNRFPKNEDAQLRAEMEKEIENKQEEVRD